MRDFNVLAEWAWKSKNDAPCLCGRHLQSIPPKFLEGEKSQTEWCGTMDGSSMVEPSSRFKLWGHMAETLQKIEELDQHMGELRSSQIQCLAWLFICWAARERFLCGMFAALAPLWAMEVWMRYIEVISWRKTLNVIYIIEHIMIIMIWYDTIWFDMIWYDMTYRFDSSYGFNCPCWACLPNQELPQHWGLEAANGHCAEEWGGADSYGSESIGKRGGLLMVTVSSCSSCDLGEWEFADVVL